ncbi:MAG: M13 family metallopeptidase [Candidatus Saccharibacteria bacterium]
MKTPDLDHSIRPQDDFFGYVNSNWIKNNPIPANETTWGTFSVMGNDSTQTVKDIIDELIQQPDEQLTHDQKLIKTYFSVAFNFQSHSVNNLQTLIGELQKISDIKNHDQLAKHIGYIHRTGFKPFWEHSVTLDDKNSKNQVLHIQQSGIPLNRDYYLDKTDRMKELRAKYKLYFQNIHKLLPQLPHNWQAVWDIELALANASWTDIELRDVEKNYNKFTIEQLSSKFPSFSWPEYFSGLNWEEPSDNIVIGQPSFIKTAIDIIANQPIEDVKHYLCWRMIDGLVYWVNEEMSEASFEFYGKVVYGRTEKKPTWKLAIYSTDDMAIGDALGREYANKHFPESSKQDVLNIVEDIRTAYHHRIDDITWMKDSTKKRAHIKLDCTRVFIGYPDVWKDMSKLKLSNDNQITNILTAQTLESDISIVKIGKIPDPQEWAVMNAHTVNAYHDPNQLVICFPAGILQPPMYDPTASYAKNLGGIGAIIAHELTHGFDDQGSQFDENGDVKCWQTKSDQKKFASLTQNVIKQADDFEVLPGINLKGDLVVGEVIADIGGLELAVEALQSKPDMNDKKSLQELFTNNAVCECGAQRDEFLILMAKTDPHPPSKFRVNCTVSHVDKFYEAYDVKPSDKLYLPPEKRAHIW